MTVKQIQSFLLWLRQQKMTAASISVGGVVLEGFVDYKLTAATPKIDPPKTMWEQAREAILTTPANPNDDVPEETKID